MSAMTRLSMCRAGTLSLTHRSLPERRSAAWLGQEFFPRPLADGAIGGQVRPVASTTAWAEPDRNVLAVAWLTELGVFVYGLGSSGPGSDAGRSNLTLTCWKPLLRWALAWREYARR